MSCNSQELFKDGKMKLSDSLACLILLHTMNSSFISPDAVSNLEASAERTLPYYGNIIPQLSW